MTYYVHSLPCTNKGNERYFAYRTRLTRKTMQVGEDPFKFMIEVDRFVADLHRLGDISTTKLKNV